MNRGKTLLSVLIVVFVFCKAGVVCAVPMSTAFTYQGRLNDGGSPAEGLYNFGFLLYDDPNEAMVVEIAPPVLQEIEVIDGYFTTNLDFDVEYSGEAYWLGIALWDGQDPNTVVMLSPRQEVTPTPYSIYAASSDWSNIYNMPGGFADDVDDVGITSETDPTVPASVKDGTDWGEISGRPAGLDDGDDVGITVETDPEVGANTTNYLPKWNGSALVTGTIYDDGNVGIGTESPMSKLSVGGDGLTNTGVYGVGSTNGVYGSGGFYGVRGSGGSVGVEGINSNGSYGRLGSSTIGVYGNGTIGVAGSGSSVAVHGKNSTTGFYGRLGYDNWGGYFNGDGYFSGNVGIGTTSPTAKLHIGGTAGIDGIKFPDGTLQTTSADALEALVASLEARITALENPPGWGTAELIETDNVGGASYPQVGVDGSGDAVAVWQQYDGTRWNIWSNRYVPGTGWGSAVLIEADNSGSAYNPQVAIDPSGNAVAVWQQYDGTRWNIWSNRYVPGTGWGSAVLIETDNAGGASSPQVAIDPSGNAVAVWYQWDGTRYNIWSNRYVAGTGWGTAVLIETDNAGDAFGPQVAFDGSGNAVVVWYQSDGTRLNIWSNRYVVGTGWGTAVLIETDNAGSALDPQVAVDGSGDAVAVWSQSDGTIYNIWSNRYVAGTGWGAAEMIETDNAGGAGAPQVGVDPSGNAVAVWKQFDGTRDNIWSNRYIPGTGWGSAVLIETDNAGHASYPQVGVDGSGNAVAVWVQSDGVRSNIWSNRYVAGTGWGTAELIETDNVGHASYPQVAVDVSGNAVAVWQQNDGARDNIRSNRYVKE